MSWVNNFVNLQQEWYTENKNLSDFSQCSHFNATWKCQKGTISEHIWSARIHQRTRKDRPTGCPFCSGRRICFDNCLLITHPYLAAQLDEEKNRLLKTKNGDIINALNITHAGRLKVWWKCKRCNNSWKTSVGNRSILGQDCPKCFRSTSKPELMLFRHVQFVQPDAINGAKIGNRTVDILCESIKTVIEYDGYIWHNTEDNFKRDKNKNEFLKKNGYKTIRCRDNHLRKTGDDDISFSDSRRCFDFTDLKTLISKIRSIQIKYGKSYANSDEYLLTHNLKNLPKTIFKKYNDDIKNLLRGHRIKAITTTNSDIAKEWCFEDNGVKRPEFFTKGSNAIVAWKCNLCNNKWVAQISHRTRGIKKCPACYTTRTKTSTTLFDPKQLNKLYRDDKKSCAMIGKIVRCSVSTVYKWLKRYGIPLRLSTKNE